MKLICLFNLEPGNVIKVLAGEGEETEELRFKVIEPGVHPVCEFSQRLANEDIALGPVRVCLEGCSVAKSLREGCYNDEKTTEHGDGLLYLGGFIIIVDQRETAPPIPKTRHPILPPISGLFIQV